MTADAAVAEALASSANPDRAQAALTRLTQRDPAARKRLDAEALRRVATVAGASEALGALAADRPAALDVLPGALHPPAAATVRARCAAALDGAPDAAAALAASQRLGLLNVAARDLLGRASLGQVTAELSDLAEGVVAAALDHVTARGNAALAVVAMGKLGGRELNYVSDVDLVFACDRDAAAATLVARRLLRLLGETTPEGRAYEVDVNLRPEGKDGPLVRTVDAYEAYYRRWAKPWEHQALLKARTVAGDPAVAGAFCTRTAPFVWPDRLDSRTVAEIQRLKGVVERSDAVRRAGARQVKLAPGGLRDIEFAVQLLQLVHGRHDRSLRSTNTLEALTALAAGGYVGRDDAATFAAAYVFLRTVEHRLQLVRLRRTHTLPDDGDERRSLARALGFDAAGGDPLEAFDAELRRVRSLVRGLHEKLFYRPLLARFAQLSSAEVLTPGDNDGRLAEDAARERLTALGFADPQHALRHLAAMASGVSRTARMLRTVLPAILPTLAAAPDPDGGLAALRSLVERRSESPELLRTLRDSPPFADLLARVLGSSAVVGRWLERQPEVPAVLADAGALARATTSEDYARMVAGLRRRGDDVATTADAVRRLRRREAVRIAVRDLTGLADVVAVGRELSALAGACLQAAVDLVVPAGVAVAVVGLGKLGASELGYASDLDVLLVYEPADAQRAAERAAEQLLGVLSAVTPEGQAFRVDPNLRPEGKDGPLARTPAAYVAYYQRWAQPWELQALTQARPVAGDAALGERFVASLAELVYPTPLPAQRLAAMRRMKARIERERATARRPRVARGSRDDTPDLKLGSGGLSDVEWTAQLLQLRHGGRLPALRRPGTLPVLAAAVDAGVLAPVDAAWLADGWRLCSRVRNALYLAGLRDTDRLPTADETQERVAHMLGFAKPGGQALSEELARGRRRVRKVHERYFYDAP